jgi:hypothetical protein
MAKSFPGRLIDLSVTRNAEMYDEISELGEMENTSVEGSSVPVSGLVSRPSFSKPGNR